MSASDDDRVLVLLERETVRELVALARLARPIKRLAAVAGTLEAFARNPVRFVLGVVVVAWLAIFESLVLGILNAVILFLGGSQPFSTPPNEATSGLADIPILVIRPVLAAGGATGDRILATVDSIQTVVFEASTMAGPFAPLVHIVLWGTIAAVVLIATWRVFLAITAALNLDAVLALLTGNQ